MDDDTKIYNIDDDSNFLEDPNASIIKVIGVGGGGGNAVNYMYRQDIPNVNFVVCNTDKQHLDMSPVPTKLLLGWNVTHGRGAGNNPEVGRECAEESADEIRKLFEDGTEMVFITAGMGGGTGTGAAPVVARIAKDAGMLTIGIVTVPFFFEGESKILKALDGAEELKKHVDALLVINNENLVELYKDYSLFNAFEKADDTLANAARSISEIISEECFINVDFQDVKTILKDSGTAIISTACGEGEHRVSDAINNALHSPLLKRHDIKTSKRLLFKFSCARDADHPLQASEINEITRFTSELPSTIDVKWGIADNPELGDKVKITVLASGFDVTLREANRGENGKDKDEIIFGSDLDNTKDVPASKAESREAIEEFYGADKVRQKKKNDDRQRYVVLTPDLYDDHEVIALMERTPTYNRDQYTKDLIRQAAETAKNEKAGIRMPENRPSDLRGGGAITFGDIDD